MPETIEAPRTRAAGAPDTAVKKLAKRNRKSIIIEQMKTIQIDLSGLNEVVAWLPVGTPEKDQKSAKAYLRKNAVPGERYRLIRVLDDLKAE